MAEYSAPAADAGTRTTEEDLDFLSQSQTTRDISVANPESIEDGQSGKLRDQKMFLCKLCDKDLAVHWDESFTSEMYQCCVCRFTSNERAFLQRHINIHCERKPKKEYTKGGPHLSEKTCNVCKREFACKTFLDQHCVIDHKEHFKTHCWVCRSHIDKHLSKCGRTSIYECCACGQSSSKKYSLLHNNTHVPQLFCIRCKEEYPAEEKDWHDKEFKCMFCPQTFQCHTTLENHLKDHNDYMFSRCTSCPETLDMHRKGSSFQCCVCLGYVRQKVSFRVHLCSHKGIRLFKCPVCEKRFMYEKSARRHSENCVSLPIQCEKCRARFPTKDSLNSHCLKQHT